MRLDREKAAWLALGETGPKSHLNADRFSSHRRRLP